MASPPVSARDVQEAAALRDFNPTFVRFGSGADIIRLVGNVRFAPQSGHRELASTRPVGGVIAVHGEPED